MTDSGALDDLAGPRWPSGVAIARAYAAQRDHFLRLYERLLRTDAPVLVEAEGEEGEPEPSPPSLLSMVDHTARAFSHGVERASFRRSRA